MKKTIEIGDRVKLMSHNECLVSAFYGRKDACNYIGLCGDIVKLNCVDTVEHNPVWSVKFDDGEIGNFSQSDLVKIERTETYICPRCRNIENLIIGYSFPISIKCPKCNTEFEGNETFNIMSAEEAEKYRNT